MHEPFGHEDTSLFETKRNIQSDYLNLLLLIRKSWMSCKRASMNCISTAQVRWKIQNDYLTQTLVFLVGVELKKMRRLI